MAVVIMKNSKGTFAPGDFTVPLWG